MSHLLCLENSHGELRALVDHQICTSNRVFDNMLTLECRSIPRTNYFDTVQRIVTSENRRVITSWMLELAEDCKFEDTVFPAAVSIMDRFLCLGSVSRAQFQLTACTALILAAKLRSVDTFPKGIFEVHSHRAITTAKLISWETLMAFKMNWELESLTASDFVDHIVARLPAVQKLRQSQLVRSHANVLAHIAITDSSTITTKPSLIASAAVLGALRGLNIKTISAEEICQLSHANLSVVEGLVSLTEKLLETYSPANHPLQCFVPLPAA